MKKIVDDYKNITKYYNEQKVSYYTCRNPDNSNIEGIICNVPIPVTEDEIKAGLTNLKYSVLKVIRLLDNKKL